MNTHYTDEKNTLILISLLKAHGIRRVIVSPGATNIRFVASIQNDSFFTLYSVVDERSAAYMACGMAAELKEPVVLSCTGATASRNYAPGLTEAFYRHLPILAITSSQHFGRVGQMIPQVLDRSKQFADLVIRSEQIPSVHTDEDAWACNVHINAAILALYQHGGGPVHINLETEYSKCYDVLSLPNERKIVRYNYNDMLPLMPEGGIAVFCGAHLAWNNQLTKVVDSFCQYRDAVVLCDKTSNYHGDFRVDFSLLTSQREFKSSLRNIDLMIHIGEISGAYPSLSPQKVWRVHPDGEVKDPFKKLTDVFEMDEVTFFEAYTDEIIDKKEPTQLTKWNNELQQCRELMKELPFSNVWIAQFLSSKIPSNSIIHFGILNSLRSWNLTDSMGIDGYSNTGGFGIDGVLSSAIGAAIVAPEKIVFCIIGDLAFFYDMNALGSRHLPNNIRILLINNGKGTEFTQFNHAGAQFGDDTNPFIAAAGHYGNKSVDLVRHYAEDLGLIYLSARDKNDFIANIDMFVSSNITNKPLLFEAFTDSSNESNALKKAYTLLHSRASDTKNLIKHLLGEDNSKKLVKFIKK